ncbi:hypothetical protein [Mucilaginibacter sp. UYCu711]|uniref:hypothetical protein n=1 Tax=Mucilaginibacter sp. UYCu711 TaxID=3156339 RepID=UPI003D212E06
MATQNKQQLLLYTMQLKSTKKYLFIGLVLSSLIICAGYKYQTNKVIQVDISYLLNIRPVTTLTNGKLLPWTKGVDRENGYLTTAAALANGETNPKAIADDPLIPANAYHPAILLHYNNNEGSKNQAMLLADTNTFTIKVPKNKYAGFYICLTSAYGKSNLQYELIYDDGSETKTIIVPDWANDVPDNDPYFSYVVHDLAKWTNRNFRTEADHHNIHALNVHPDTKRALTALRIKNLSKTYVLFWAATGVKI